MNGMKEWLNGPLQLKYREIENARLINRLKYIHSQKYLSDYHLQENCERII